MFVRSSQAKCGFLQRAILSFSPSFSLSLSLSLRRYGAKNPFDLKCGATGGLPSGWWLVGWQLVVVVTGGGSGSGWREKTLANGQKIKLSGFLSITPVKETSSPAACTSTHSIRSFTIASYTIHLFHSAKLHYQGEAFFPLSTG